MVLASAKHPAMLFYLDNSQSIGPNSQAARRARGANAQRGLNENYARELLELHTLGVAGGYTQQDVQELAKILTGWTVGGLTAVRRPAAQMPRRARRAGGRVPLEAGEPGRFGFAYREAQHEPGARQVLGVRYADEGVMQGERIVRDLCRHPATAQLIARKLVTHFVADEPPAGAVQRVATVFRDSTGDLKRVAAALIDLPDAWRPETRKFRPPQEWLVAILRAFDTGAVAEATAVLLRQLRHPLWSPQAPDGFGDTMQQWADPDSLLNRAELARTIARRAGVQGDPRILLDVVDAADAGALRSVFSDPSISAADRLALAIAGPAFQWR
jgi:uncharacterized protein (DUF1800 family)